jgi:uncharacterized YigZ family protein
VTGTREYRAPTGEARAELKERGSRFVALLRPAGDEEEAAAVLAELGGRYGGATHLCWAWRLGSPPRERSSDAGEPHGTAGRPMLQVLRGGGLSDVVAAVARWYGGVKLGKGGLARAYSGAVQAALGELESEIRRPTVRLGIEAPFDRLGAVRRLVRPPAVAIEAESYGERASLVLRVEHRHEAELREALAGLGIEVAGQSGSPALSG